MASLAFGLTNTRTTAKGIGLDGDSLFSLYGTTFTKEGKKLQ